MSLMQCQAALLVCAQRLSAVGLSTVVFFLPQGVLPLRPFFPPVSFAITARLVWLATPFTTPIDCAPRDISVHPFGAENGQVLGETGDTYCRRSGRQRATYLTKYLEYYRHHVCVVHCPVAHRKGSLLHSPRPGGLLLML